MKTILIPIDLAGENEHLLKYAADFCLDVKVERVVLLKSYYVSVYTQVLPTPDFVQLTADEINEERKNQDARLKALGVNMMVRCNCVFEVQTAFSTEPLLRAIHDQIAATQPNLVMVGSDKTASEEGSYLGEQLIAIAKTSPVPVVIVPENVKYQKIEQAVVPCDFAAISRLNALKGFHSKQRWVHPQLMVLNVNAKQKHNSGDKQETANLLDMLNGYDYKVYHSEDKDTVHGILTFARENDVQMIISLPGKYSFFYNLTHRSITNALALNATRPVLILK
jgi:nucleotide-binding universal stress UspA family protein